MLADKKILAVIPARGGSKGLPRKNLLPLLGKPLIAWTIDQARASRYIDRVIVSTEDEEIAGISVQYGAEVPFIRPPELATETAGSTDVMLHALEMVEKAGDHFEIMVLLQPTSPLRTTGEIDGALEDLIRRKAGAIVSVCETTHPPFWANTLPGNLSMQDFLRPEVLNKPRQELPVFYQLNGAIYIAFTDYFKENRSFTGKSTFAYIMPKEHSIDIDTLIDFRLAGLLLEGK